MHQCAKGSWNAFTIELAIFPTQGWFFSGVPCLRVRHWYLFCYSRQKPKDCPGFTLFLIPSPVSCPVRHHICSCSFPYTDTVPSLVHVAGMNDPSESLLCLYLPVIPPDAPQVSLSSGPLLPGCTGRAASSGWMLVAGSVWLPRTLNHTLSSSVVASWVSAEHKATQGKDPYVVRCGCMTQSWPEGV